MEGKVIDVVDSCDAQTFLDKNLVITAFDTERAFVGYFMMILSIPVSIYELINYQLI